MKSLCSFRMLSTSTMFRCEKEVFTHGKLNALESGQRLFAKRKTRTFTGSLSKENIALEKWNRLWQVRQLIFFHFGILFLFSFSDTCVSRLCAAAGSFSHPRCLQCRLSSKSLSCKARHHGWDGTLDLPGCCCR